jgi:SAM-dependent methyltransferase
MWRRGLRIPGVRFILLTTSLPLLRLLRRVWCARPENSSPLDILVSRERFVPEFQSDVPYANAHIERYRFAERRLLSSDRVLDAACGSGYGTDILSHSCLEVIGIDRSAAAVAYAREKYNGSFHVRDVLRGLGGLGVFDVVVSLETIEHIRAPIARILRALACRARRMVIGSVPYMEEEGNPFHHHFHLNERDLRILERYGDVTYFYQEPEPGYRIHPCRLPRTQNLIFVLMRMK